MTEITPDRASGLDPTTTTKDGDASPSKRQTTNILGLGLPDLATPSKPMTILNTYPHLGHYIHTIIASAQVSPPRGPSGTGAGTGTGTGAQQQHPLSVSSSGESDDEDSDKGKEEVKKQDARNAVDRDALVKQIVDLLDNEEEEQVKDLLKPFMGELGKVSLPQPIDKHEHLETSAHHLGRDPHGPSLSGLHASQERYASPRRVWFQHADIHRRHRGKSLRSSFDTFARSRLSLAQR